MQKMAALALLGASLPYAETPKIAGVWKADLQKSKLPGPPVKDYLVIIEQKMGIVNMRTKEQAPQVILTTGMWGQFGERRSNWTFFDTGKPVVRPYDGIPTRITGASSGNTINVSGEVPGTPNTFKRSYELSSDGQTLTETILSKNGGHEMQSTVVLVKQPDAAAEPLRKPEELAATHFKNVKTEPLKKLPASEFIDQMRYFAWSLGKDCEFCHVEHHFDSDDKKEKKTARKMIDMTAAIDQNHFEGHPEVRCFTCHEGHSHPLSRPLFPDEIQAAQAEEHQGHSH